MTQQPAVSTTIPNTIDRPVLRGRLDQAFGVPLTLLVAQAGSGKSILLAQWVAGHPERCFARVAADGTDADPVRFGRKLLRALAVIDPSFSELAPLLSLSGDGLGEPLVDALAAQLAERETDHDADHDAEDGAGHDAEHDPGHDAGVTIIIDDVSRIPNQQVVRDLGLLADRLPPSSHLVMSSRIDPPLAWGRRRLENTVVEIRQQQLRLTADETARMLAQIMGDEPDARTVQVLHEKTEGWAAGLQMAGLRLRLGAENATAGEGAAGADTPGAGRSGAVTPGSDRSGADSSAPDTRGAGQSIERARAQSVAEFVDEFGGSDRIVADYLSDEVLLSLPASSRERLLRISVFDAMCAELVADVAGVTDAQLLFERLENESLFVVALDDRRHWFRFHHLFRDLLRYRLRAADPALENELLLGAAQWHLDRDDVKAAGEYLLRAKAWNRVIALVLERGVGFFERGELATLVRWIEAVPVEARVPGRDITLLLGVLKLAEGWAVETEDLLTSVAADPAASVGQRVSAASFLAVLTQWRSRALVSVESATRAVELLYAHPNAELPDLPKGERESLLTMAIASGGRAYFLAGDVKNARIWLRRSNESPGASYPPWRVSVLGSLALQEAWVGRTRLAAQLSREAFGVASQARTLAHPSMSDAYLSDALVALEHGEATRGALAQNEAALRARANRRHQCIWAAEVVLAALQAAEGRLDEAEQTLRDAADWAVGPAPVISERIDVLRSQILRARGQFAEALQVFSATRPATPASLYERASAHLSLGQLEAARPLIESLGTPPDSAPLRVIESLILRARFAAKNGRAGSARRMLGEALQLAELDGLVDVFVRAGTEVHALIADQSVVTTPFETAILDRARRIASPPDMLALTEPLTARELEILSYLPGRASNAELAERCFVSVNTIKTHMAHIYRKLDAPNRTGAVAAARQLGLL